MPEVPDKPGAWNLEDFDPDEWNLGEEDPEQEDVIAAAVQAAQEAATEHWKPGGKHMHLHEDDDIVGELVYDPFTGEYVSTHTDYSSRGLEDRFQAKVARLNGPPRV